MTRDTTLSTKLHRTLRTCLLGRRGQGQDPFLGLEIRIHRAPDRDGYEADLEIAGWREFPDLPVEIDLKQLRSIEADVNAYGQALGHALFDDDACGPAYRETLAVARSAGQNLRVRLIVEPSELQEVHWERIFHPYAESWQPLGSTAATPFSRYVAVRQWDRPAPIDSRPVRLLVVIASPADLDDWSLDAIEPDERTYLHELFDNLPDVEPVYLESGSDSPPTLAEIRKAVAGGCDLVHFLCHGGRTDAGTLLYLEDEDGNVDPVKSEQLVDLVRVAATQPACIFLAACESAARTRFDALAPLGPALVDAGGVHAAVAMTERVGVDTAQTYAAQFYNRLLEHGRVDQAVNEARALVQDEWDWGVPVLFMRVPDGRLLIERTPAWCMPMRVALIALALLLIVGAIASPSIYRYLNPTKMTGVFNIAIADFGELSSGGNVRSSTLGSRLSATVYDRIDEQVTAAFAELEGEDEDTIQVWHTTSPHEKNVDLRAIRGSSPEARARAASRLADRIEADLVIYGHLGDTQAVTRAGALVPVHAQAPGDFDVAAFQLEFYNRSESYQDQPDTASGRHLVGQPIGLPFDPDAEPTATIEFLRQPLSQRTEAMFWIARALTLDFLDRRDDALQTMLEARRQLADWDDDAGQSLLAYFAGREALGAREYELAQEQLQEAIDLNPDYANAHVSLGSLYYDKAQLFYVELPIPDDLERCVRVDHLERAAQSEDEVFRLVDQAMESVARGIEIAPDAPWPPIETTARMVQGNVFRLKGETHRRKGELDEARRWFTDAIELLDEVEQDFAELEQMQYVAWTQLSRGTTHYLRAHSHIDAVRQGAPQATELPLSIEFFQQSAEDMQRCLDSAQGILDPLFRKNIIECGCEYFLTRTQQDENAVREFMAE